MTIPLNCQRCGLPHELEPADLMIAHNDLIYGFRCVEGHISRTQIGVLTEEIDRGLKTLLEEGAWPIEHPQLSFTCSCCGQSIVIDLLGELEVYTDPDPTLPDYMLFFCASCDSERSHVMIGPQGRQLLEQLRQYPIREVEWEPLVIYEEDLDLNDLAPHPYIEALLKDEEYVAEIFTAWTQQYHGET